MDVVSRFPGAITGAEIDETRIRAVAEAIGLADRVDEVLSVWRSFHVLEETLEIVTQVRAAGVACYLATNQDRYRAMCMKQTTPYAAVLDGSYYSCDIGVAKPSSAFFEHIVSDLDLSPDQLLFLDDTNANVIGAQAAGLQAQRWAHSDGTRRLREILGRHGIDS